MSSLSLSLIWLESPYAPSVEGFPQSMEFSETCQFVCQRSATGDGDDDILKFTENAENSPSNCYCTSSSVTRACDPCGDNKLVEHWLGPQVGSVVALIWAAQSKPRVNRLC
ncbi:hypothetical protein F2Q70_00040110 [Brassica cretica]|uniref:Uncharacterized protein n=1 Tax=Brassica cretica TaxID=69181 RepID=A0A8S9K524_BRACR|nr:hypothetical protein F2Q70_00040110 [Brassica cretica]